MDALKRLLKYGTSAVPKSELNKLHELLWHKAIYTMPNAQCQTDMVVIGLGHKKGSKSKINQYIKTGTVKLN